MKPLNKYLLGGGLVVTSLVGGAVGASMVGTSGAATATTTASPSSAPTSGYGAPRGGTPGPHQANGITETLLTGDTKTKAVAAAEAAVPGATVQRAETDAEGAAYEVHMTKSDGSVVTVKLDAKFNVTQTIDGMG